MNRPTVLVWFRQDLRIEDNPALMAAAEMGTLLPIFIQDDEHAGPHALGGASKVWLHHALSHLNEALSGQLQIFKGPADQIISQLVESLDISAVFWNRCYEPWRIRRDTQIKTDLSEKGVEVKTFNSALLWEPWQIKNKEGKPYRVFTPFYRKGCLQAEPPRQPLPQPKQMQYYEVKVPTHIPLEQLALLPSALDWPQTMVSTWDISPAGAMKRLERFVEKALSDYKAGRNMPAQEKVSRLSPYLHFGQISPHQVWAIVHPYIATAGYQAGAETFCSELGWREFSHHLLYHFPTLPTQNLQAKFDAFPWQQNPTHLKAWQQGKTGYPIVDAGMRELWQTGYMHNRVRMIVGSFLVKNLMLHWHLGEAWFWDCLVDADLANNSASWQWVAGCGADAAPYFRIFNPVTQGQKFDETGDYVRQYVPEISQLPDKYIHQPWEAPANVLAAAGIHLGQTYPKPIVDLKTSRQAALDAFASLKAE